MPTTDRYVRVTFVIRRGHLIGLIALGLLGPLALRLASETLTMTTTYPSPAGIYRTLITTAQTLLARDGGNVGIRTGTNAPVSPLEIGPQDNANEGGEIRWRGAGANRYFYMDNFSGNMRLVSQDASGESVKLTVTNDGRLGVRNGAPAAALDVNGGIAIRDGSQGANKVLTSDANGAASWRNMAIDGSTLGNKNCIQVGVCPINCNGAPGCTIMSGPFPFNGCPSTGRINVELPAGWYVAGFNANTSTYLDMVKVCKF